MNRRIDSHRRFVRVLSGYPLVHLEQVAVALANRVLAQPLYRIGEVQIDAPAAGPDSATFIAHFLCRTRCDVARRQISVAWILSLEVVITIGVGNVSRL